jgi:hypothetical protein
LEVEALASHVLPEQLLLKGIPDPVSSERPGSVEDRLVQKRHHGIGGELGEVRGIATLACGRIRLPQEESDVASELSWIRGVKAVLSNPGGHRERLLVCQGQPSLVARGGRMSRSGNRDVGRVGIHDASSAFSLG